MYEFILLFNKSRLVYLYEMLTICLEAYVLLSRTYILHYIRKNWILTYVVLVPAVNLDEVLLVLMLFLLWPHEPNNCTVTLFGTQSWAITINWNNFEETLKDQ